MRKSDDGEKKREKREKKEKKTFLVATNVVASRPPERRPTGTPTARAKSFYGRFFFRTKSFFDEKFLSLEP